MTENVKEIMKQAEVGYTPGVTTPAPVTPQPYAVTPEVPTTSTVAFDSALRELTMATTAMEKVSALKKLEALSADKQKELIGPANREFKNLQTNNPKKKQFVVNGCIFKSYTKPASYAYPEEILQKEAELKQDKAAARKDGTATVKKAAPDIETDKSFSVSVMP